MAKKNEPQEVELVDMDLERKFEENREVAYRSNLVLATALVASVGILAGKKPNEAAAYFSETWDDMQDWYHAKPLKKQIDQLLETVLPERYY